METSTTPDTVQDREPAFAVNLRFEAIATVCLDLLGKLPIESLGSTDAAACRQKLECGLQELAGSSMPARQALMADVSTHLKNLLPSSGGVSDEVAGVISAIDAYCDHAGAVEELVGFVRLTAPAAIQEA